MPRLSWRRASPTTFEPPFLMRNLTDDFFDLSSGQAGAVLQNLPNYGVRLAVVCPAGNARFSTHFAEMVAGERQGRSFGVFLSRSAAWDWVRQ